MVNLNGVGVPLVLQALSAIYTLPAEDALHRAVMATRVQHTLSGHTDDIYNVASSPDATLLATTSRARTLKIRDAGSGVELRTIIGHEDAMNNIAFSPDG